MKRPDEDNELFTADEGNPTLIGEFIEFLRYNKKWWLAPILLILFLIGLLVFLSSTAAAPFIYTLF